MNREPGPSTVVLEPEERIRIGFFACWKLMVLSLARSRPLVWQLFKRDVTVSYKQSALGLLWVVITPVVGILSWVFMNYAGVVNPGEVGVPYPLFVLFGTTIWGLFMAFYATAAGSLSSDSSLLLQVRFPHEALVVRQMAQTAVTMVANMLLLLVVLLLFQIPPSWMAVLFPFMMLPIFFLGAGIGMLVSVLTVVVRDVSKVVAAVLGLTMFITPVIYSPKFESQALQGVIWLNPLTYLVGGAREVVLNGRIDHSLGYAWSVLFALLVFLLSWRLFFLSSQRVAEKA
jgi:ABC-type polysaccharide/polyol phosphate export permease